MVYDEDEEYTGELSEEQLEEKIAEFGHELEESFAGDDRVHHVELLVPGEGGEENFRLRLAVDEGSHFFVAVLGEDHIVRVGLATEDEELSKKIEDDTLESGGTLSEHLAESMEDADELEFEAQHFHDDYYYFCSEIPYESAEQIGSHTQSEAVHAYLNAYIDALGGLVSG